jgi:hypothetical protein
MPTYCHLFIVGLDVSVQQQHLRVPVEDCIMQHVEDCIMQNF